MQVAGIICLLKTVCLGWGDNGGNCYPGDGCYVPPGYHGGGACVEAKMHNSFDWWDFFYAMECRPH